MEKRIIVLDPFLLVLLFIILILLVIWLFKGGF